MQFLIFEEEKFYALCTMKDKNFAPKQNERDCPMTPHNLTKPVFMRVSNKFAYYLETKWQHFVVIWRIKILFHNVYKETLLIFRSKKLNIGKVFLFLLHIFQYYA